MPGPYFKDQSPQKCGCYYPDVTRIRDDLANHERVMYCMNHGEFREPLGSLFPSVVEAPIPTDEWREEQRNFLRASVETPIDVFD